MFRKIFKSKFVKNGPPYIFNQSEWDPLKRDPLKMEPFIFILKGKIFVLLGLAFWGDGTMAEGSA